MKLTPAQERAKAKLTNDWQSAYRLQERISTLDVLVKLGLAKSKTDTLGALFSPTTAHRYKLA